MLGIRSDNKPLEGEDAIRVLEAAKRIASNSPNEREKIYMERENELRKKYKVTWKI